MTLHNSYLILLSALFAVVFAIMIYSLVRHQKTAGESAAQFFGPSGSVQWLWAVIPIAILVGIDFALIETPADRSSMAQLAIAQNLPSAAGVTAVTTEQLSAQVSVSRLKVLNDGN
ncbi:cytochrome c oxidase subunit II transmembrane domain-containing protein [Propionivibrio sp.]|uniref:cytochrome c oxidase subunit II transmembrane domain-containing protein n=1 Tax=Propionivibrio sp. TaxID=2212460 RepID=UPI0026069AB0|nr:cytochrome c oxidase subunit II transmembrane domain-containing protein [Propionivibrio sp.]